MKSSNRDSLKYWFSSCCFMYSSFLWKARGHGSVCSYRRCLCENDLVFTMPFCKVLRAFLLLFDMFCFCLGFIKNDPEYLE
jgi:hypothetical protein